MVLNKEPACIPALTAAKSASFDNGRSHPSFFVAHDRVIDISKFTAVERKAAFAIAQIMEEGQRAGNHEKQKKLFMVGSSTADRLVVLGHTGLKQIAEIACERTVVAHLAKEIPDFKAAADTIEAFKMHPIRVRSAIADAVSELHANKLHAVASHVWKNSNLLLEDKL